MVSRVRHEFPEEAHAVHLWRELWRRVNRDANARYGRRSLYERLKRTYGVTSASRSPRWTREAVGVLDDFYDSVMKRMSKQMQRDKGPRRTSQDQAT